MIGRDLSFLHRVVPLWPLGNGSWANGATLCFPMPENGWVARAESAPPFSIEMTNRVNVEPLGSVDFPYMHLFQGERGGIGNESQGGP